MEFVLEETGQGLVEYGLIIILVAVIVLLILYLLGPAIGHMYSEVLANF